LQAGEVLQPEPDRLAAYQTHPRQRRGQWPDSPEIRAAICSVTTRSQAQPQDGTTEEDDDRRWMISLLNIINRERPALIAIAGDDEAHADQRG
jgi:hypothetical protein